MDMANSAGCQGHMQAPGQGHNLANGTSATTVLLCVQYSTVLYSTRFSPRRRLNEASQLRQRHHHIRAFWRPEEANLIGLPSANWVAEW